MVISTALIFRGFPFLFLTFSCLELSLKTWENPFKECSEMGKCICLSRLDEHAVRIGAAVCLASL